MTTEIDIWRSAHLLINQSADELLAAGNLDGQQMWKRIIAAVCELLRTTPAANERRQ